MKWPQTDTERLGSLIDTGLSSRHIARTMHRSPGSVQGRAWRLGWKFGRPRTEAERLGSSPLVEPRRNAWRSGSALRKQAGVTVYVTFDDDTYAEILSLTRGGRISRVQVIRELVEWGLEVANEGAGS